MDFVKTGEPRGADAPREEAAALLQAAAADAVRLVIDTMNDPGADIKLRMACADRVLERAYGKTGPLPGGGEPQAALSALFGIDAGQALEALGYERR